LTKTKTSKEGLMIPIIQNSQQLTMSSREIAELLGKQHSNIKVSADRLAEKGTIALQGSIFEHNGNYYEQYLLSKRDSLILVAQNSPEFTAAIVDRWQELEQSIQQKALPDFNNPIEAARAWADAKEAEQKAIATKAQINDKRTATIMGRLGRANQKIKKLEDQLQDVGSYLSVIGAKIPQRVNTPLKDNVQSWRLLKQLSIDMQLEPKCVKDERYGDVLAYHVDVIEKFKAKYL